jgi:hypothetical protein
MFQSGNHQQNSFVYPMPTNVTNGYFYRLTKHLQSSFGLLIENSDSQVKTNIFLNIHTLCKAMKHLTDECSATAAYRFISFQVSDLSQI